MGAFYAFPDVSRISNDSRAAAEILLERARVATVPGIVFGAHGEGHLRFSFSTSIETIEAGLDSLRRNPKVAGSPRRGPQRRSAAGVDEGSPRGVQG